MTLVDPRYGLRAYLLSDGVIAGIVGNAVYPIKLPQAQTQPSIVYTRISETEGYHMQGPNGLLSSRFQIDAWAKSIDVASTLANAIKERIGGFSGTISFGTDSPADFVKVQGIFLTDAREDYDNDMQMYRMSRDYFIWYEDRQ